jgi:hypothetical protein
VPTKGTVQFSFGTPSIKSGRTQSIPATMVVSIKDATGAVVYDKKHISVFSFSGDYISDPLELTIGSFTLTEFFIVDENNNTIFATPLEGSDLAYLVNDPAPIAFSVTKDATTKVSPEVLAVGNNTAVDFGYVTFSLNEIATLSFSTGIFIYDDQAKNFILTTAHVDVTSDSTSLYSKDLQATTTEVRVRDGFTTYHVKISKSGYDSFEQDYSATNLKTFTANAALIVKLFPTSLSSGLVAWFPFTGNALDASGNANNGTVHGATLTTDKNSAANSAYLFDGASYINIPSASLKLATYTYSAWVNATSLPSYGSVALVFSMGDNVTSRGQNFSLANNYASALTVGLGGGSWNDAPMLSATGVQTNVLPSLNQWYHVVLMRSTTSVILYVNNQFVGSATVPNGYPPLYTTSDIANIGINPQFINGFVGKIDDFRIYNRVLSTSEIGSIYNQ